MNIGIMQDRPPYVRFELVPVEDRNASIAAGRYVARDVEMALIVPAGSKDEVHREAGPWLDEIREKSRRNQYNPQWVEHFNSVYRAWKEGNELPVNGTPIKTWPLLSPAQVKNLLAAKCFTVEDLAVANEPLIAMLGMGGRDLKGKAQAYLEQANNGGKVASELAALKVRLEDMAAQIEKKDEQIASLMNDLNLRTAPGRSRNGRERPVADVV